MNARRMVDGWMHGTKEAVNTKYGVYHENIQHDKAWNVSLQLSDWMTDTVG